MNKKNKIFHGFQHFPVSLFSFIKDFYLIFLSPSCFEDEVARSQDVPPMTDPISATRVFCGALLLPTIATICGKIFFYSINSNFQRTIFVSAVFFLNVSIFGVIIKNKTESFLL